MVAPFPESCRRRRPAEIEVRQIYEMEDFPAKRSSVSASSGSPRAMENCNLKETAMRKQIYVNLPIKNMKRTEAFFERLGFDFNPQFTNEQGACMVIADDIYAMLLVERFFQTFTPKPVATPPRRTEVLMCLSCDSRAEVDELVRKAVAAGGTAPTRRRTMASCTPRLRRPRRPHLGADVHDPHRRTAAGLDSQCSGHARRHRGGLAHRVGEDRGRSSRAWCATSAWPRSWRRTRWWPRSSTGRRRACRTTRAPG